MTILYGGKIHAQGTADDLLLDSGTTVIRVPRIRNDATIAKIEHILNQNEATSIESVSQPKQNLESFFIQIVDKAREEKIVTSGAKGGETAAFLKGDEEGDVLIDKLVESQEPVSRSTDSNADDAPEQIEHDEMLHTLMKSEEQPTRADEAMDDEANISSEADASVIDALLDKHKDDPRDPQ
jgi:ABC-2 type transport system ATP-binding protein